MLTLHKIRNVRTDLRGPMTHGQIADLARITSIELFVIRYSPRLNNGGGGALPASRPESHCPHAASDHDANGYPGTPQDARLGLAL